MEQCCVTLSSGHDLTFALLNSYLQETCTILGPITISSEEGGAHQALTLLGDKQAVNSYWTEGLTEPHPSPENV